MKKPALALLAVLALGAVPAAEALECALFPQEVRTAKVPLKIFAEPSEEADSIGFYAEGAPVMLKMCAEGWCEISSPIVVGFVVDSLLVVPQTTPAVPDARPTPPVPPRPPARTCCRVCRTGKACGNSCIARNLTCRQPRGCACNG